VYIGRDYMYS